jgi:hypothetical protein
MNRFEKKVVVITGAAAVSVLPPHSSLRQRELVLS